MGAPLQSHLDEIIEAMDDQCTWNEDLAESRWHKRHKDGWKKHPHHDYYTNGLKIDFKPSGDRGVARSRLEDIVNCRGKIERISDKKNGSRTNIAGENDG